jgi:glycosyltransferase involved in cell wall biosynthesis
VVHKVVHFIDSLEFGGTEQALLNLLRGLDPERWQRILFCRSEPGLARLLEGAHELGIPIRPMPRLVGKSVLTDLPQLVRVLRNERPHIFHAHLQWPLASKYGLLAAALARVPGVVATSQLFFVPEHLPFAQLQYRVMAASVDRFIAVSCEVAKRLQETVGIAPNKIRVVHNGIPPEPYRKRANPSLRAELTRGRAQPVVFTLARLDRQKGIGYLLEAAVLVPDAVFVVAGDGPERESLQLKARELGVEARVLFLGHRRDVPDLLACCDLFVLPSLFEGLPVSILEAMAAGKPVISSAIGGTNEAVIDGQTGLLVPPGNPAELARAVTCLLSNPTLAAQMAANARARVEQEFSAEMMVQRVDAIYEELLAARGEGHNL